MIFTVLISLIVCFAFTVMANWHLCLSPLTEDEGNHYYLVQFHDRGARAHISYNALGIFDIAFWARIPLCGAKPASPIYYQYVKIIMHALGSVSICLFSWLLEPDFYSATIAGISYGLVTQCRSCKFWATYGEHAQNVFIPLALAGIPFVVLGHPVAGGFLGGIAAGIAIHCKPTALLIAALPPLLFPFYGSGWLYAEAAYFFPLFFIILVPFFWLGKKKSLWPEYYRSAWHQYIMYITIGQVQAGIAQILHLVGMKNTNSCEDYSVKKLVASQGKRVDLFKKNMERPLRDLWFILLCMTMQVFWGGVHDPHIVFLLILYLLCMLLTQHIQQNYLTPHFNTIWPPICILAAMFLCAVLRGGVDSPGAWLMAGLVLIFLGQRAYEFWTLRHDHAPWLPHLEATCIGKALYPVAQRTDVLLAMGVFPSINIYADCPGIPTHLFVCMDGKICHEEILTRHLRENPPHWITFYTPTAPCPWDMAHIMEISGQVYAQRTLPIPPDCVAELAKYGSGLRQAIFYRRDDMLCAINQCELGREALQQGDEATTRRLFAAATSALPQEMALRLDTLNLPDALEYLQQAKAVAPAQSLFLLAELFQARGALPPARKYLAELAALEGAPYAADPRFHTLRAQIRADMPNSAGKRLAMLVHALKLHPFHVPALRAVAALLLEAGQPQDAAPLIQRLLTLRPDDPQAQGWAAKLAPTSSSPL